MKLLGVIGWPVSHSVSPAMQGAALRALGLDWIYGAFAVPPERLSDAVRGAAALGFVGLNVTIPHKEAVLALCDPDGEARRAGAVNTLVFSDGGVRGLNTDVYGFRMLLAEAGAGKIGRAAILGAGGAARAAALALTDGGAVVTVISRSARRVGLGDREVDHVGWEPRSIAAVLERVDLLVDATPRGLGGAADAIDLSPLSETAIVLDLAARRSTALIDAARARGLRAAAGGAMLLHQGARALEAWTGAAAPIEVMRAALVAALP